MNIMIYLAGATTFLFCFFFFADHTSEHASFVYLQYTSVVIVFWLLAMAINEYTSKRPRKISRREAMETRRTAWYEQKESRRSRRKW